ncbi:hypothetical protein QBC44DRAFT_360744 [Cladorrhinum sp. PSN332]|nr:hypothetical protein QBC44DRAFT_360744 [Cladorrhinum sp. PSN332]
MPPKAPQQPTRAPQQSKTPWNPKGVSSTNPHDRQNNCIQVTLARLHNCATVNEFWSFPPLQGVPIEVQNKDIQGYDINAVSLGTKIGWLANKVDWRSDRSKSAWTKMLENLPSVPGAYIPAVGKMNFYLSYLVTPPGAEPWGHAVVGTVINSGGGKPLRYQFRDFQHGEGDDVSAEVRQASEICVVFFNYPQYDSNKREVLLRELLRRNTSNGGRPRSGALNDVN